MAVRPTPRPWRTEDRYIYAGRKTVAELPCGGVRLAQVDETNAALIVKCVNAHDRLRKALKEALPYLQGDHFPVLVTDEYGAFLDRVQEALNGD